MEGTFCELHACSAHCGKGKKQDFVTRVVRVFKSTLGGGGKGGIEKL
jgi:hypothetical protein